MPLSKETDRMRRAGFLALVLCVLPGPALARPFPAGKCTVLDEAVAFAVPPVVGPRPAILVLPDVARPKMGQPDNAFVADLVLSLRTNGTVASARALCTNVASPGYTKALLSTVRHWSFAAQKPGARYAYRVVISERGDSVTPVAMPAKR
jgi:hypothetical protein